MRNSLSWRSSVTVDSDDASTTSLQSTVTVNATTTHKSRPTTTNRCRRCSVRFEETRNVYYTNDTQSAEDCVPLWYSKTELKRFKAFTISTARAISKTTTTSAFLELNYPTVLLMVYDACCQTLTERDHGTPLLSQYEAQQLQLLARVSADRIGLETLAVNAIRRDKQTRRAHMVDAILALQEQMPVATDLREEMMRDVAQSISRAPRYYARCLAEAHFATTTV